MKKKKILFIVVSVVIVLVLATGIYAFLSYKENQGHWCAPGTHWGLGYNEAGLTKEQIQSNSRCLDNNKVY